MKATDRARLTTALRDHVAKIAADLRAKMRAEGPVRERARQLHADEQVGEDFDVWTDLLSRRAAVLWVLKSVYVRVLEDRGLLKPGRILDPEAQQLFERLAPNLGETAFLRWVYRDLASRNGGLPELFSSQPAEVALPSDDRSRALIDFWRHRDPDSGKVWSFAEERFEGELMGDLYQELDPVVKDRFALCQTPDFVRAFILDRTLTPAIEKFGADNVRLLDPACGSGHFLIDGLKRLVAATSQKHPDWDRRRVVGSCLERVVGIDLNDYACALARARLVMTAAELAGVERLGDADTFHPHVYWGDGLEQVERGTDTRGHQLDLLDPSKNDVPRASLTRPEVRAALRKLLEPKFHVVVANPPYILEHDEDRKAYQKERVGRRPRYQSAQGKYSLSAPFTERCVQLAIQNGHLGLIVANNFMKRNFGKALIEQVLAKVDLSLVIDTSQAFIPHHGTPTVILILGNRDPASPVVRVVAGKRGESGIPADPAQGAVWVSICEGCDVVGFENDFVSVSDAAREELAVHPWSLEGEASAEVKRRLEAAAQFRLSKLTSEIGYPIVLGEDDAFGPPPSQWFPLSTYTVPFVAGTDVRDWGCTPSSRVVCPYDGVGSSDLLRLGEHPALAQHLLPLREKLRKPYVAGSGGDDWYGYVNYSPGKLRAARKLAFAFVTTHNHFVLIEDRWLFNRSAPLVVLQGVDDENLNYALLSVLNSSAACFWMKQVFQPKGATSANRNHPDPERFAHEFTATGLADLPIPPFDGHYEALTHLGRSLTRLAQERQRVLDASAWTSCLSSRAGLQDALEARWRRHDLLRQQMVFLQEELDWLAYHLFGLTPSWLRAPDSGRGALPRGQRAFERVNGARSFVRERGVLIDPSEAQVETGGQDLPPEYAEVTKRREEAIRSTPALRVVERYMFKRLWRDTEDNVREAKFRKDHDRMQLSGWLVERVEEVLRNRKSGATAGRLATELMDDAPTGVVVSELHDTSAYHLESVVAGVLDAWSVPSHPHHIYTPSGVEKRAAWLQTQRQTPRGEPVPVPPDFSQGSRGKSRDFLRPEYWRLRGKLDVPKERFVSFTEVPGRASSAETIYGWAGWSPLQRLRVLLAIDEELEDAGVGVADRVGLLDSAWRLIEDAAREDASAAARLKAELQALVGPEGPSRELIDEWQRRFPPPSSRGRGRNTTKDEEGEGEGEEADAR
jgi:hypothetical protein